MAINRRKRINPPSPQTDCFQLCHDVMDQMWQCQSGIYSCGSGPGGGGCNCTNLGPMGNSPWGQQMCSYSCQNYANQVFDCFSACGHGGRGGRLGGSTTGTDRGFDVNFRRGGGTRPRRLSYRKRFNPSNDEGRDFTCSNDSHCDVGDCCYHGICVFCMWGSPGGGHQGPTSGTARKLRTGGNIRSQCPPGYTMGSNGVCQ